MNTLFDLSGYEQDSGRPTFVCDGRVEQYGAYTLNSMELVSAILGSTKDAQRIAENLLQRAGSLHALAGWQVSDFTAIRGVGNSVAIRLVAAFEAGRRVLSTPFDETPLLASADSVYSYMAPFAAGLDCERFWVLALNRKKRLIKRVEITSGTATSCLCHPREVFRAVIRESGTAFVAVHNHPSGDPAPSSADTHITRLLREASKTVEIDMLDHLIVGRPSADPTGRGWFSFRDAGLL